MKLYLHRILHKFILRVFYSWLNYPFEMAQRDTDAVVREKNKEIGGDYKSKIPYPTNAKKVLAEFEYKDKHWVIYI